MSDSISWMATVATIIAASMTAANMGSRITGYGFVVFTVGAVFWIAVGLSTDQPALLWTNIVLLILDLFGVWRWLGRQTRIEEGSERGAQDSRVEPGEDLFPVSLLTKATVAASDGKEFGNCVDAMAGCSSGRIAYLVFSEGGVAGVGETLKRIDWSECRVSDERVEARISSSKILETIERDHWPAR
jgi:hypothetical protein